MKLFSKKTVDFIVKASRQKSPEWLDKNRSEYEAVLVEPMKELMAQAARALGPKAPGYRFPLKTVARIRRSADRAKAQGWYKDWIGVSVSRDSGSMYEDLPALYFNISAEDVFTAGGLYMPSARQTKQIRSWIDKDPSELESLLKDGKFREHFKELGDERVLKTKPRDYPLTHPRINWLKLTGFYVWRPIKKREFYSADFPQILIEDWRQVLRFNAVLDHYTQSWPKEKKSERFEGVSAPYVNWDE